MQTEEVMASDCGVTLTRAMMHNVAVYVVTCPRVPGKRVFLNLAQSVDCYGMELLLAGRLRVGKSDE